MASTYGYATYAEILALTGTTISSTNVDSMITQAEIRTRAYLSKNEVTPVAGDETLKAAVIELTCYYLVRRGGMDGSRPNQLTVGEISVSNNTNREMESYIAEWQRLLDDYILEKNGNPIDQSTVNPEATIVRQDHIMPLMKLDQRAIPGYHDKADDYSLEDGDEVT